MRYVQYCVSPITALIAYQLFVVFNFKFIHKYTLICFYLLVLFILHWSDNTTRASSLLKSFFISSTLSNRLRSASVVRPLSAPVEVFHCVNSVRGCCVNVANFARLRGALLISVLFIVFQNKYLPKNIVKLQKFWSKFLKNNFNFT